MKKEMTQFTSSIRDLHALERADMESPPLDESPVWERVAHLAIPPAPEEPGNYGPV